MMEPVAEDKSSQVIMESDQKVRDGCSKIIHFQNPKIADIDKFDFYKRAEKAFTVVMTGDLRIYAHSTPCQRSNHLGILRVFKI